MSPPRVHRRMCACGTLIELEGPMELWDVPMLAHVRTERHQAWSREHIPPDRAVTIFERVDGYERRRIA